MLLFTAYPYTPIKSSFEDAGSVEDMMLYTELEAAVHAMNQRQEYSVTIPICLDEVDLEGWKQCSCELETSYYNQQGEGCFRGMLRATA